MVGKQFATTKSIFPIFLNVQVNLTSDHYTFDTRQDLTYSNRYESRLYIGPVNELFDYGTYVCKAYNNLGETTFSVQLEKTSKEHCHFKIMIVMTKNLMLPTSQTLDPTSISTFPFIFR